MIPGDVRAQVLQEPVGGSHADQGWKSGVPSIFLGPGGQEEPNGTPHLTQAPSLAESQGGGSYSNIYKDDNTQEPKLSKHDLLISAQGAW